jgi:ADP-heptose:LPS heptosyltransferase
VKNLVACSTGPLHIAAFIGIRAVGLFSPRKPIHPGRWQPLGKNVSVLLNNPACPECKKKKNCMCIQQISVERVLTQIQ